MKDSVSENKRYYIWNDTDELGIRVGDSLYVYENCPILTDEVVKGRLKALRDIGYLWFPSRITRSEHGIANLTQKIEGAIEIASAIEASTRDEIAKWDICDRGMVARQSVQNPNGIVRYQGMFFFDENGSIDMKTYTFSASPGFAMVEGEFGLRDHALAALAMNMCYSTNPDVHAL